MPIRRHGAGWEVRIQHGLRRISKTVATRSDAQYLEATIRRQINDTRAGRTPTYTLEEAFGRWIRDELPRLKSQEGHRSLVKALVPHIRGKSLTEIPDVAERIKAAGFDSGLAAAPINRRLALLKRVGKLAYRRWRWLENDLGSKIELLPGEVRRTEWVTPAEGKKLMASAKPEIREAIRWALLTGLRRGEILSLTPAHFRNGAIYLKDTKSGLPRTVPIPDELNPKRFPFDLHPTALSKGFQDARQRAGLPDIRYHDLRRSYATWLLQGGTGLGDIRDLLGHSNVAMTSRYIGSSLKHLRKAVRRLPSLARRRNGAGKRRKHA
jgi:integrase